MKSCTRCGETKPLGDFAPDKSKADGTKARCKTCLNKQARERRAKERSRGENNTKVRKYWNRVAWMYGITRAEFDEMIVQQSGRCDACNHPLRDLRIDHCHSGGQVRGLLCHGCNTALGFLNEDLVAIRGLYRYLKKHSP